MSEHDLNAVLQIEISAYFYPWTRGNFADSLAAHYGCIVMEHIDQIKKGFGSNGMVIDPDYIISMSIMSENDVINMKDIAEFACQ